MLQPKAVLGERVFELMADRASNTASNDDRPLQAAFIEVDNVSFAYRVMIWC